MTSQFSCGPDEESINTNAEIPWGDGYLKLPSIHHTLRIGVGANCCHYTGHYMDCPCLVHDVFTIDTCITKAIYGLQQL